MTVTERLSLILIIIMIIVAMLFVSAHAEYIDTNSSYAIVTYDGDNSTIIAYNSSVNNTPHVIEVYQGDTLYWGDIADLRLVEGWFGKLVHKGTGKIVDVSSYTRKIYIDPKIFNAGEWDQWSDFDFDEDHGNTVAFYVKPYTRPANLTNTTNTSPLTTLKSNIQPVPTRHVADYLVARGDALNISTPPDSKVWLFGTVDGYYGLPADGFYQFNVSQIQNLQEGNYKLIIESPSNRSVNVHMKYDEQMDRIEYFDPDRFQILYIDLNGLDPRSRLERFKKVQNLTYDTFIEKDVIVQDPTVDIISLDQVYFRNQTAVQTIRGYSNVEEGTLLTVIVDKERHTEKELKYSTFYGNVSGSNPGDMRWFQISVPLLFDNMAAGHHTIEVSTKIGGEMHVDYDVYEAPESSFIPNNTIKYVNGSEWRPDPTPKIVEKIVTVKEYVTVTVPVTPSQESVNAGQWDAIIKLVMLGTAAVLFIAISVFVIWYLVYTYLRKKREDE